LLAPFLILHTVVFGPSTDHGFQIRLSQCPLSGAKRTLVAPSPMSANDPKRTFLNLICCDAQSGPR
jgi:hypothetical protein